MLETNVEMIADEVFCRMPNNGSQRRRPAATSRYGQTRDVLNQSLERRDVLCFHNEYSDEVEKDSTVRVSREQSQPRHDLNRQ